MEKDYVNNICFNTKKLDLINVKDEIFKNYLNDLSNYKVRYISILGNNDTKLSKKIGSVISKDLNNEYKFIIELASEYEVYTDIYNVINTHLEHLKSEQIDVVCLDYKYMFDFNLIGYELNKLKSEKKLNKVSIKNIDNNHLLLLIDTFDNFNIPIDYIEIELNEENLYDFIFDKYKICKHLNINLNIKFTNSGNNTINFNFTNELVNRYIKSTEYTTSEFIILLLTNLNISKIINLSSMNLKQFLNYKNLMNSTMTNDSVFKFLEILEESNENN